MAKDLWCNTSKPLDEQRAEWQAALANYETCASDHKELDEYVHQEYAKTVQARKPRRYVTKEELVKVIKWKFAHGKFRPLMGLVQSNSAGSVETQSDKALSLLLGKEDEDISVPLSAVEVLCELKGIGPASASALLAPLYPRSLPFMSDEAMEAIPELGPKKYTLPHYDRLRVYLSQRAEVLGSPWTAETVGRALWSAARAASPSSKKRKR